MIFYYTNRLLPISIVIIETSPETYEYKSRDSQPNIRQSSGNPTEEGKEALLETEVPKIPKENPLNQLIWTHRTREIA